MAFYFANLVKWCFQLWQLHQAEQMVLDAEEEEGDEEDEEDEEDFDVSDFFDEEDELDDEDEDEDYPVEDEETFEPQWFERGLDSSHIPTLVLVQQLLLQSLVHHVLVINIVIPCSKYLASIPGI